MREIKFRAWDKIQRQMRVVSEMDLQQPNNTVFGISYFKNKQGRAIWLSDGEFELMQYTGLRDKNGKEIYEGDIIEPVPDSDTKYEVVWNPYRCGFWLLSKVQRKRAIAEKPYEEFILELFIEPFERAVIGNVWENPELLGVTK